MTLIHAVLNIDHHHAKLLQFDSEQVQVRKVQAHTHDTGHHGSQVRSEHEFYGEVCDELAGLSQVVVTGSHTALSDFRHYVGRHRSAVGVQIVGWETVNQPTEPQLVAFARKYFIDHAHLASAPPKN